MKLSVSIPHAQKEYDVELPPNTTGKRLFEALSTKLAAAPGDNGPVVYELFSKRAGKKIYPDYKDQTLEELGIAEGDTIVVKKDMDPGSKS